MTDEERKEAERLADLHAPDAGVWASASRTHFLAGYAAACDAKRAEIDAAGPITFQNRLAYYRGVVKNERARSAKLYEALKAIRDATSNGRQDLRTWPRAQSAVAEYEVNRD